MYSVSLIVCLFGRSARYFPSLPAASSFSGRLQLQSPTEESPLLPLIFVARQLSVRSGAGSDQSGNSVYVQMVDTDRIENYFHTISTIDIYKGLYIYIYDHHVSCLGSSYSQPLFFAD